MVRKNIRQNSLERITLFELPEYKIIARQMNQTLVGKIIQQGTLGNTPHKFVWYNRTPAEFEQLTTGKVVGHESVRGRWLFLDIDPGLRLVLGECGGRIQFHPSVSLPACKVPPSDWLHGWFFT